MHYFIYFLLIIDTRKMTMLYVFVAMVPVLFLDQARGASLKIVDLTHTFGPDNLYWPGSPPFNFTKLFDGLNEQQGFW